MICEMIWDPSWILKLYLYQRINSPCPEISIRSVNNKPVTTATRIPSVFSKSDIFLNGGKEVIHGLITEYITRCVKRRKGNIIFWRAQSLTEARQIGGGSTYPLDQVSLYTGSFHFHGGNELSLLPFRAAIRSLDTRAAKHGTISLFLPFLIQFFTRARYLLRPLALGFDSSWRKSRSKERERGGANAARIKRKRRGGGKGRAIFIRYVQFSQSRRGNFLLLRLYYIRFLLLRARVMLDNGVWNNRAECRAPCVKRVRMGKKGRDKKIFTLLFFIPLLRTALPFLPALPTKRRKMILEIRGRVKKWFFADV